MRQQGILDLATESSSELQCKIIILRIFLLQKALLWLSNREETTTVRNFLRIRTNSGLRDGKANAIPCTLLLFQDLAEDLVHALENIWLTSNRKLP